MLKSRTLTERYSGIWNCFRRVIEE
jgi:solute carrier family 25 (adenine nucleotide translocator) protein 4/5/6/31